MGRRSCSRPIRARRRCSTSASWSASPTAATRTAGTTRPTCRQVIGELVHDLQQLDPADAAYFAAQQTQFETVALADYNATIAAIKAKYAGTQVGASESIFAMLAPALGLDSDHAALVPEGDQRGHRRLARPTSRRSTIRSRTTRSRSTSTTARTSRPTCRRSCRRSSAQHIPYGHDHRDAHAGRPRRYQEWQTAQLRRHRGRAGRRRRAMTWRDRSAAMAFAAVRRTSSLRSGVALRFEMPRCDSGAGRSGRACRCRSRPASSSRSSARTVSASRRWSRPRSALLPLSAGSATVLGRAPGATGRDIGYLPQRRSFDRGLRVRGVDVVRLGADGDRWGVPIPGAARFSRSRRRDGSASTRSSSSSARARTRRARSARSPAASSSAC